MLSNISGFIISALVHIVLATLILGITENPKPRPPKAKPVALTLAMFKAEASLAPKPKKIIKKEELVYKKPEPLKKVKVAKEAIKTVAIKPIKAHQRLKPVKPKLTKKRNLSKARVTQVKRKVKPKIIKRLKPKQKKVKVQTYRKAQARPPVKRVTRPVKRAVVRRPVRKVPRTFVNKKAYQPVRHIVRRQVSRKIVSRSASQKTIPHSPRQRAVAVKKRFVKPPVRPAASKPRVVAAQVTAKKATTTHASGQALKSYKARLRQLIEANKHYPKRAKRRAEQGTVIVSFVIFSNGQVKNIRISKSSGSSILDNSAKKAVGKVSGKLPFSPGINKQQWQFTVPVVYRLR